jgi:cyclic-di-GMP-binding protein
MANDPSFDVVSKVDLQEVDNAVNQAAKEMATRYDFRGSKSKVTFDKEHKEVALESDDESRLKAVIDIVKSKFIKRGLSPKALDLQKLEGAVTGAVRQKAKLIEGIPQEKAKLMVKAIKDGKYKVQVSIQGDQLRVSGKSKDELQTVMQVLKGLDLGVDLQFTNYR